MPKTLFSYIRFTSVGVTNLTYSRYKEFITVEHVYDSMSVIHVYDSMSVIVLFFICITLAIVAGIVAL